MVISRSASSTWSDCPERIISHHYRLYANVRPVIDTSPPFSMYNSPKSVHYVPRRASSADPTKRRRRPLIAPTSKPQRELSDFLNESGGLTKSLRLPLPVLRNPLNEMVQSKLLGSKDYQPPLHRKKKEDEEYIVKQHTKLPPTPPRRQSSAYREKVHIGVERSKLLRFKDDVYNDVIERGVYTDRIIEDAVKTAMEKWAGEMNLPEMELIREEIFEEFGVTLLKGTRNDRRRRSSEHGKSPKDFDVEELDASSARSLASRLEKQAVLSDGGSSNSTSQSSSSTKKDSTTSSTTSSSGNRRSSDAESKPSTSASESSSQASASSKSELSSLHSNQSEGSFFD